LDETEIKEDAGSGESKLNESNVRGETETATREYFNTSDNDNIIDSNK
jgi:hypothetical protein